MAKVHITLVGGQPAPVYNGIIYANPDKIIYIYSEETKKIAEQISGEFSVPNEMRLFNPVDMIEVEEDVLQCKDDFSNDDVTVNISSGTKTWAFYFSKIFGDVKNAAIFFVDQNNNVWNFSTKTSETLMFDMDMVFRLYGNPPKKYTLFSDYTDEDYQSMKIVEQARSYNQDDFKTLTTVLQKTWQEELDNNKNGLFAINSDVFVKWEKGRMVRISLSNESDGKKEFLIESPHATEIAFNSGWFEYKIARMLSHWEYSKEIRMNCKFPSKFSKNKYVAVKYPKNEVDIIVNTGKKILFVECKTSIYNSTDIDKFATVVKNYSGIGSKALFITEKKMYDIQKEKCAESGIIPFSIEEAFSQNYAEDELFYFLEKELFNINAK